MKSIPSFSPRRRVSLSPHFAEVLHAVIAKKRRGTRLLRGNRDLSHCG
jgi:hypothetical protein